MPSPSFFISPFADADLLRTPANADIVAEYYSQRGSTPGTLLIAEATAIAPRAVAYTNAPGIWSPAQIAGWKKVVEAVHAKGSFIFLQLWATGRAATVEALAAEPDGPFDVVSASNIPFEGGATPRPLTVEEIKEYPVLFAQAAKNFVDLAGGDGVESELLRRLTFDHASSSPCDAA